MQFQNSHFACLCSSTAADFAHSPALSTCHFAGFCLVGCIAWALTRWCWPTSPHPRHGHGERCGAASSRLDSDHLTSARRRPQRRMPAVAHIGSSIRIQRRDAPRFQIAGHVASPAYRSPPVHHQSTSIFS